MNVSGRKWAYFGVILGFTASITANIASTVLTDTSVSLALRMPFAVFWPLATYVAIEVLVRTDWQASWSHRLVRLVLALPVASVAAYVSYLHQHHLMTLAGEPGMAQLVGPLAVDGMLFGMTATLIVTRIKALPVPGLDEELRGWDEAFEELTEIAPKSPVSPVPVSAPSSVSRAPRGEIAPALRAAVSALRAGDEPETGPGASRAVIGRYRKVLRVLRDDPNAVIDVTAEKVRPELVDEMRAAMREVRVR